MRRIASVLLLVVCLAAPRNLLAARLDLRLAGQSTTTATVKVGQELDVQVWVDSEGQILSGAAVFLSYDDTVFELAREDQSSAPGAQPFAPGALLTNGEVYRNVRLAETDPAAAASGAQLDYSIVRAADQGAGPIASFRLRALAPAVNSTIRIDETGARETRVFLPDGSHAPFRFINPLRLTVQGITLSGLPARVVLARGQIDASSLALQQHVYDPLFTPAQITWHLSPTRQVAATLQGDGPNVRLAAPGDASPWERLIVTATNPAGQSASDTVDVFVDAPPVLSRWPRQLALREDEAMFLGLDSLAEDPDTPAAERRWQVIGGPHLEATVTARPARLALQGAADWSGATTVSVRVSDDYGFADSAEVQVQVQPVNDPPALLQAPNLTLVEGRADSSLSVAALAADPEGPVRLSWSEARLVGVAQRHGALVVSSRVGGTGTEAITLTATDEQGLQASAPLTVTVLPSMAPAVVAAPAARGWTAGQSQDLPLDDWVVDPDNADEDLVWTVTGQQALRVLLSTNRVARVEAPAGWSGIEDLAFTVTDPAARRATFTVRCFVAAVAGAPVLDKLPELSLPVDSSAVTLDLDDYVYDADDERAALQWFVPARPDLSLRVEPGTRILTVAPTAAAQPGALAIELRVQDPAGHEAVGLLPLVLTAGTGPTPPASLSLRSLAPLRMAAGSVWAVDLDTLVESPAGASGLSWTCRPGPHLTAVVDAASHLAMIAPTQGWSGVDTVAFVAAGSNLAAAEVRLVVTVAAQTAPTLAPLPPLQLAVGAVDESIDLDDYVAGVDGAEVTWQVTGEGHVRALVDAQSRRLIVIPATGWSGTETLTLVGVDGASNRLSGSVAVTVAAPAGSLGLRADTQMPMLAGEREITLDSSVLLSDDAAGRALTWQVVGRSDVQVRYVAASRQLTLTCAAGWTSDQELVLQVSDGQGATQTGRLRLQVLPDDGSVGIESDLFQLAVIANPTQPDYLDVYVVAPAEVTRTPQLQLQDSESHRLGVTALAPGLWYGSHVIPSAYAGTVNLLALALTPDATVLRARLERVADLRTAGKPVPAQLTAEDHASGPVETAIRAQTLQAPPDLGR